MYTTCNKLNPENLVHPVLPIVRYLVSEQILFAPRNNLTVAVPDSSTFSQQRLEWGDRTVWKNKVAMHYLRYERVWMIDIPVGLGPSDKSLISTDSKLSTHTTVGAGPVNVRLLVLIAVSCIPGPDSYPVECTLDKEISQILFGLLNTYHRCVPIINLKIRGRWCNEESPEHSTGLKIRVTR